MTSSPERGPRAISTAWTFEGFWDDGDYSREKYCEPAPSGELIASIEEELGGYRLPDSYVELRADARRRRGRSTLPPDGRADELGRGPASRSPGCTRSAAPRPGRCAGNSDRRSSGRSGGARTSASASPTLPAGDASRSCSTTANAARVVSRCVVHVDQEVDYRITRRRP
ncbi:hypothetical protein P9209_19225 [Prescottella defluvii]|nr:hypothetical protein P9209_19225 [Prescottella defluvii]